MCIYEFNALLWLIWKKYEKNLAKVWWVKNKRVTLHSLLRKNGGS